jgi:hypothetical protein
MSTATKHTFGLIDSSVTYTGKDADGFYSTLLLVGDSRQKFRKVPNVKDKVKLASLDMGDFFQADACSLSADGDYTLDQKEFQVCDLAFKVALCIKDYEGLYLAETMKPGSNVEENFPNGFVDYLMNQMALKGSATLENYTWQGDTAGSPASLCDGLQKKMLADSAVLDVAVDGTKLHNATYVMGELTEMYQKMVNSAPAVDLNKCAFFLNKATIAAFKLALIGVSPALVSYNQGNFGLNFLGVPIIEAPGLGDYKAVLADPENFVYLFDLASDENQVEMVKDPLNPKQYYLMGSLKFGVGYLKGAEIVYYN